ADGPHPTGVRRGRGSAGRGGGRPAKVEIRFEHLRRAQPGVVPGLVGTGVRGRRLLPPAGRRGEPVGPGVREEPVRRAAGRVTALRQEVPAVRVGWRDRSAQVVRLDLDPQAYTEGGCRCVSSPSASWRSSTKGFSRRTPSWWATGPTRSRG